MENDGYYECPPPYHSHEATLTGAFSPTNIPSQLNAEHGRHVSSAMLPIAIPQMGKGRGAPFMRVNTPILQEYQISEQEFIGFIDTLNVVSAASPPLKVLDLAGGFIGMVPHHWAQLASNVIQLVAKGGTALVSKSRTDAFISQANAGLFGSRGLRVRLVTTEALLVSIGFPPQKLLALRLQPDIPLDQQPHFHDRLLLGLQGYVSHTFPTNLPPPAHADNVLDKLSADQVARDIRAMEKKMQKKDEKSMKKMRKHGSRDLSSTDGFEAETRFRIPRSKSLERQIKKTEHDIEKINKKASRDLRRGRSPSIRIQAEKAELVKRRDELLEMGSTDPSHDLQHDDDRRKEPDSKFVEKLLWVLIDRGPINSE
ncbi:hypothetical protein DTO217A2_8109 [Paecilomyces variotii]|nr:hypothetical protein DTO217A2_8109 [Paecilomyces variotii]